MTGFIDAHHHVWDPTQADYAWLTDDLAFIRRKFDTGDLREVIGPAGVTGTVLVQTRSSYAESAEFLALAEETDFILGVVAWVDLTSPERVMDTARQLVSHLPHEQQENILWRNAAAAYRLVP